ncbi:uncharacterized protein LOC134726844 [Mytilus trossulus]|uniref:uncharacterized protein LOC134726844 n=1 Tax=Mytilus trossulus TaxID=6551 RepID=UPI003005BBA5
MYTKVLTFFVLIVTKHTQGQDVTCEFPCELRGRTLSIIDGTDTTVGVWTFTNDGVTSSYTVTSGSNSTDLLTCYQRIERFLIFRVNNDNEFLCYLFDYTPGMTPISFTFGIGDKRSTNDVCTFCDPQGSFKPFLAKESGQTPTGPDNLPCGTVSYCSDEYQCGANDTLPEGCPPTTIATTTETSTEPTTESTTEAITQPTKRCHKRRKHH